MMRMVGIRSCGAALVEAVAVTVALGVVGAISLPMIAQSREGDRLVTCTERMRQASMGMSCYARGNDGWLPGPHTSGAIWSSGSPDITGSTHGARPDRPIQNMDWASPIYGTAGLLPPDDLKRAMGLFGEQLLCPQNGYTFDTMVLDGRHYDASTLDFRFASYSAVIEFHAWPSKSKPGGSEERPELTARVSGALQLPQQYSPRLSRVGSLSEKVFLQEGARFISPGNDGNFRLSFNGARYQVVGGAFMADGPHDRGAGADGIAPQIGSPDGDPREWFLGDINVRYAWRHEGARNHAFFDGHVEHLAGEDALAPELYAPTGTRLKLWQDGAYPLFAPGYTGGEVLP